MPSLPTRNGITLGSVVGYLESLRVDVRQLVARVDRLKQLQSHQLHWKLSPASWSVLECVEHLALTSAAYNPVLRETSATAPRIDSPVAYRPTLLGRLFVKAVSPDPRLKVKTVAMVTPASSGLDRSVLDRFEDQLAELDELLAAANERDFNRATLRSPLNRRLKLRLGEAFTVVVRHAERHIQQAENVTRHADFPKGSA